MEQLGKKANKVTPIFITIDPSTDTPEVIKDYISNFDARMVGLTGSDAQIKQAANAYKSFYS